MNENIKVLGVNHENGVCIGHAIDALLSKQTGQIAGICCQLFGLPARVLYISCHDGECICASGEEIEILSTVTTMIATPSYENNYFYDQVTFQEVPLKGLEIYDNNSKLFLGVVSDYIPNPKNNNLMRILTTGGDIIIINNGNYNIVNSWHRNCLILNDYKCELRKIDQDLATDDFIFSKKVVQVNKDKETQISTNDNSKKPFLTEIDMVSLSNI